MQYLKNVNVIVTLSVDLSTLSESIISLSVDLSTLSEIIRIDGSTLSEIRLTGLPLVE